MWASCLDGIYYELSGDSVIRIGEIRLEYIEGAVRLVGVGEYSAETMDYRIHCAAFTAAVVMLVEDRGEVGSD